jgi:hypothetical protein
MMSLLRVTPSAAALRSRASSRSSESRMLVVLFAMEASYYARIAFDKTRDRPSLQSL